jgi:threonine synthase
MRYISTRGHCEPLSFTEAVATGLAPDGGLYVPEELPSISHLLEDWESLDYAGLCLEFFKLFATDVDGATLKACVDDAYSRFDDEQIAPLKELSQGLHVLELFHGPTLAFKDFALQLLGNLYEEQIRRTGRPITVLGATSGDTGAAAIHGLLGKEGVNIHILYPNGGVSPLQERQMTCTGADNVFPIGIDGTFDDAQTALKDVFGDLAFRHEVNLSAVNSINLARVLAQSVYYIYAWLQLSPEQREAVTFIVPTGNFGNVLAGWWARKMGLPVKGFRIATNQNDILYRLFTTGRYLIDDVRPSYAPSMDIQIASNFERFLYYHEERDPDRVWAIMDAFKTSGDYTFVNFQKDVFSASRANDTDIKQLTRGIHETFGYIVDPHTACGFQDLPAGGTRIVLGTAHPAKFPDVIEEAVGLHPVSPALEALKEMKPVRYSLEPDPQSIKAFIRNPC